MSNTAEHENDPGAEVLDEELFVGQDAGPEIDVDFADTSCSLGEGSRHGRMTQQAAGHAEHWAGMDAELNAPRLWPEFGAELIAAELSTDQRSEPEPQPELIDMHASANEAERAIDESFDEASDPDASDEAANTLPPMAPAALRPSSFPQSTRSAGPLSQREQLLVNKYRVERVLGRNRIAVNAQVRHVELRQRFLLLYLHSEARKHLDSVARFLQGARQALRLSSEHVVRTSDAGRLANGVPYVAMDYPAGSSLRHMLDIAGPLAVIDAVDYVLQAAVALSEAHALGMCHGHLSTANLYMSRRPDGLPLIKVLGFGVADALCSRGLDENADYHAVADDDSSGFPETPAVLAPEQLRNDGEADAAADIWGLGAVLHELLAGAPVFQASSAAALVATIAADPPTPITTVRSDVPAGLESLILRCLEKDKHARFPSLADLAAALSAFAAPDSQRYVERIVKTMVRSSRAPSLPGRSSALVYVGPAAAPESRAPEPATLSVRPPEGPSRFSIGILAVATTLAVASAGVLGAAIALRLAGPATVTSPLPSPPITAAAALAQMPAPVVAPVVMSAAAPAPIAPSAPPPAYVAVRPRAAAPKAKPAAAKDGKEEDKVAKSEPKDLFDDTR